ncbi:MAG: sodium:proton antiporter [Bacteroidota bacterium]
MEFFHLTSFILMISAGFGFLNQKTLKLPTGIALMLTGLLISLMVIALKGISNGFSEAITAQIVNLDFSGIVLEVMLSFLLFAGALHTDLGKLAKVKWTILSFATLGVMISTFTIGFLMYFALELAGQGIDLIYCLLFGALISPTDPIAVMSILKKAGVPKEIEIKITGESLFNDGIGVVVFLSLFEIARQGTENVGAGYVVGLLAQEVIGGIVLGLLFGYVAYHMLKNLDEYRTEVLITLAVATGGYSTAIAFHVSGPLVVVVAGLFIGNSSERGAMSQVTQDYINKFWEILDEALNAILFVLIGLELLVVKMTLTYLLIGLFAAVVSVVIRYLALSIPSSVFGLKKTFESYTLPIMTWGGLRGGISIALALSLTADMEKEMILAATYVVVLCSLLIQGLSLEGVVKRLMREEKEKEKPAASAA